MFNLKPKFLAAMAACVCAGTAALAQDNSALLNVLIKKGILTDDEAKQIKTELTKSEAKQDAATSGGKFLEKLVISGRFQTQYAGLSTDISGTNADPVSTNHFFLRRMYLGAKAIMADGWSANLNYDFAGTTFDAAFMEWKQSNEFVLDVGFRKVPIGLEEWYTSSGSLKAIERSPGTRYFVESNNGRRLGAGSYRTGVYAGGKTSEGLFYNVAITNPERDESGSGVTSAGSAANNNFAYWGNLGYTSKVDQGTVTLSASLGFLPDQGGKTLGAGDDLTVYNVFLDYTSGGFDLQLEYFGSNNDHGVSATQNSKGSAYSIQPAYKVGDIEYVLRYSYVDSDGRGLSTSDLIRSAPSGGTMDKLTEWFAGINYYIRGNDVKWQIGYIYGESKDTITGGSAKATTNGVRSQLQINY